MARTSESVPVAIQAGMSSSGFWQRLQSPLTFGLMLCGGVGALLFTASYLLEGVTRPGYDAWQQPISALSLGPGGWVQQVNFAVFGVLLILSSVGWYRLLTPVKGAIWFPLFQSIGGLGLIGAAVFSMDPFPGYPPGTTASASTLHGTLHTILAYTIIISLAVSCYRLAVHLWNVPHWRGWAVYSVIAGVVMQVLWGVFIQYATSPAAGLIERLSAGSHALWLCLLVVALWFQRRRQRLAEK